MDWHDFSTLRTRKRYDARVVPASQIVPTSRRAFALTALCAAIGATWVLCLAAWEEATLETALVRMAFAMIGAIPCALIGAAAGGLLALLLGARLSRQYCWLFAATGGVLGMPILLYTSSQLMFAFDIQRWLPARLDFQLYGAFGPLLGGILLAVVTTRGRVGLATRSRRAAWVGCALGLAAYVLVELIYNYALHARNVTMHSFGQPSVFWRHVTFGGFFALMAAGVAAAWCAERPIEVRWEVLPLNEIIPQTTTTADPASPVAR
ncbi:MAG: hypothetical protein H7Z14_13470 [Anaerolineae bacterium]|nr:hypothetical protein [Phycisphaerae bacterium]